MLWEPALQVVLLAYVDEVLLLVQDTGALAQVEACQAIYSAASSHLGQELWPNGQGWVAGKLPLTRTLGHPVGQGQLLLLGIYLSATDPAPLQNWVNLEARIAEQLWRWMGLLP